MASLTALRYMDYLLNYFFQTQTLLINRVLPQVAQLGIHFLKEIHYCRFSLRDLHKNTLLRIEADKSATFGGN